LSIAKIFGSRRLRFHFSKYVLEELGPTPGGYRRLSHEQHQKMLERVIKVKYDQEVDVLHIRFSSAPVDESDEEKPGIILDYDRDGNIVGIEILNASKRMENPRSLEYAVALA
jgi:uncharacterized protein YuzE